MAPQRFGGDVAWAEHHGDAQDHGGHGRRQQDLVGASARGEAAVAGGGVGAVDAGVHDARHPGRRAGRRERLGRLLVGVLVAVGPGCFKDAHEVDRGGASLGCFLQAGAVPAVDDADLAPLRRRQVVEALGGPF